MTFNDVEFFDTTVDYLRHFEWKAIRNNGRSMIVPLTSSVVTSLYAGKVHGFFLPSSTPLAVVVALFLIVEALMVILMLCTSRRAKFSAWRAIQLFETTPPTDGSKVNFDSYGWTSLIQLWVHFAGKSQSYHEGEARLSDSECLAIHFGYGYLVKVSIQGLFANLAVIVAGVVYLFVGGVWAMVNVPAVAALYLGFYPTQARMVRWAMPRIAEYRQWSVIGFPDLDRST